MTGLPMDIRCLRYLDECGGSAPRVAIPLKLFSGEMPDGHPNMVDLGLIEHDGEITKITQAGRDALALASEQLGGGK